MILLGSSPAGAAILWGTGSPTANDLAASGPTPVIFKFNVSDGSLVGSTFGFSSLNWMQIKGIADSGLYLYVSHNTWNTDSGSTLDTSDFKIAKVRMDNGAVLSDTSIAGYIAGQTFSRVNSLFFRNGRLYGIENSESGTASGRGYAVEILLDANGDVTGAIQGPFVSLLPDGALAFYNGLWYATSHGYAPDHLTVGSSVYKSAGSDIMTTTFAKDGLETDDIAVVDIFSNGIGNITGWEFDGAGTLFAVTNGSAQAVYSVNLTTRQATKLYDIPVLPDITSLNGLASVPPDTTAPVVTVPANITKQSAGGAAVVVTFTASALDNVDGEITPVCLPASGSSFSMGTTSVTCTATDSSGNIGTGSFTVTVEPDTTAPVVTVPANMMFASERVVTFTASALDNVDGPLTPVCVPASGTTFGFGTTPVTCTATDSSGNVGTGSFTVVIGAPGKAQGVWAEAGDEAARVYWHAPASNGGVDVTGYIVTCSPGGTCGSFTGSSSSQMSYTVRGLTNGISYTFTVQAVNSRGSGRESSPSNSVTPMPMVPDAPGIWAREENGTVTLAISRPWPGGPINLGEPITASGQTPTIVGYIVTINPGGVTITIPCTGLSTEYTLSGLASGTAYTFTAKAVNSLGRTSPESLPSNSVAPATLVPEVPGIWAKEGDESATITISRPWPGGPITIGGQTPTIMGYYVTVNPGGNTIPVPCTGLSTEYTVNGLTNGTSYTFTVKAVNNVGGTSLESLPSNSVTPMAQAPVAPGIWAKEGDTSAKLTISRPWTPGAPAVTILHYEVTISPGGGTIMILCTGLSTEYTVMGLTNDTTYTFIAKAINSLGRTSPESLPSNSVTPTALVPAAPGGVWASAGDESAMVHFSAPWNRDKVPAITGYVVTSSPGGITVAGGTSPITVPGLTNGTAYTFTVQAVNARGTSPESLPSNVVIPAAVVPDTPTVWAVPGDGIVNLTINPPYPGGPTVTVVSYTIAVSPADGTLAGSPSPATVLSSSSPMTVPWSGLTNGKAYTFTVTATNSTGRTSLASDPVGATPQAAVPEAPGIWATAGDESAVVTISRPLYAGGPALNISHYIVTAHLQVGAMVGGPISVGCTGELTTFPWTGLINGTAYNFTAKAVNSAGGVGAESEPSQSVTPAPALPAEPSNVWAQAGDGSVTVYFSAPWNAGQVPPITSYTVTCSPFIVPGAVSPTLVTGLTNGQPYTCTVSATNSRGTGPEASAIPVTPMAEVEEP
jgi:hypothetical protein